jgi:hypothetical protein
MGQMPHQCLVILELEIFLAGILHRLLDFILLLVGVFSRVLISCYVPYLEYVLWTSFDHLLFQIFAANVLWTSFDLPVTK